MAGALFGYIVSMAAALSVLLVLLNSIMAPVKTIKEPPHPFSTTTQNATPGEKMAPLVATVSPASPDGGAAKNLSDAPTTSAARTRAEGRRRLRLARYRKQKAIARRREEGNGSASEYAQGPWDGASFSGSQSE